MKEYSKEIAEAIKLYLDSIDYNYSFNEEEGIFFFRERQSVKIETVAYIVVIGKYSYEIRAELEDLKFNETNFLAVSEYAHRANNLSGVSQFKIDEYENAIVCTQCVNCNGIIPSNRLIEYSFAVIDYCIVNYGDGFIDVIDGKGTPKEIFNDYDRRMFS